MGTIQGSKIQCGKLLDEVTSYGVEEADLTKYFFIQAPTIQSYKNSRKKTVKRLSEPLIKLLILNESLMLIHQNGYERPFEVLKNLKIENQPLFEFINKHYSDGLIKKLIKIVIQTQLPEKLQKKALHTFREKYTYLNNETIMQATRENPELLHQLVEDVELRHSTRGEILQALAAGGRDEYFEYVKEKLNSEAPHLREAAYNGMYEYYDSNEKYAYLKNIFHENLKQEKAEGVRQTISELLAQMQ